MKKWIYFILWTASVTFLATEVSLRFIPYALEEPQKSLFEEVARVPLSNLRIVEGTKIILPKTEDSDIIVVGDSFPFGTYVNAIDTFPSALEEISGKRVINLGVGSRSFKDYNRMSEIGLRYKPELIIYTVFANDFIVTGEPRELLASNSSRVLPIDRELFIESMTNYQSFRHSLKMLYNHSMLVSFYKLFTQLSHSDTPSYSDVIHGRHVQLIGKEYWEPQLDPSNQSVREGIEKAHALVDKVKDLCLKESIKLLVLLIPPREMTYGPMSVHKEKVVNERFFEVYDNFCSSLKSRGINCLNLTEAFQQRARTGKGIYLVFDGHLREEGHKFVAKEIWNTLQASYDM